MIETRVDSLMRTRALLEYAAASFRMKPIDFRSALVASGEEITPQTQEILEQNAATNRLVEEGKAKAWDGLKDELLFIREFCQKLELVSSWTQTNRVLAAYEKGDQELVAEWLPDLWRRIQDDLQTRLFLLVAPRHKAYYEANNLLFGEQVAERFSSVVADIEEAGKCFALERWTACVFHCMVPQSFEAYTALGIFSLRARLRRPTSRTLIINQIEKAIGNLKNAPNKSAAKKSLDLYSEAALSFRFFKDAFRNHMAHVRHYYDEEKAGRIIEHVGVFMAVLVRLGLKSP